jgi:hypothetical protein
MCSTKYIAKRDWDARARTAARKGRRAAARRQRNGRKVLCGAWTLSGTENPTGTTAWVPRNAKAEVTGTSRRFVRLNCKSWGCSHCGPRKAARYRSSMMREVERRKLRRMLTLTLDPRNVLSSEKELKTFYEHFEKHKVLKKPCSCEICARVQRRAVPHIRLCWSRLRAHMQKRFGYTPDFIAVIEFQKSTGLVHMHVALGRFVEQAWIKRTWEMVGGGQHVFIAQIDAHRAAAYMSKYFSKELLLSAPEGLRRITTSRSIKLNEKKRTDWVWVVFRNPITNFLEHLRNVAEEIHCDSEGILESFRVRC